MQQNNMAYGKIYPVVIPSQDQLSYTDIFPLSLLGSRYVMIVYLIMTRSTVCKVESSQ